MGPHSRRACRTSRLPRCVKGPAPTAWSSAQCHGACCSATWCAMLLPVLGGPPRWHVVLNQLPPPKLPVSPRGKQRRWATHVGEALLLALVVGAVLRHGSKLRHSGGGRRARQGLCRTAAAAAVAASRHRRCQVRGGRPLLRRACKRAIGALDAVGWCLAAGRAALGRERAITPWPAHV